MTEKASIFKKMIIGLTIWGIAGFSPLALQSALGQESEFDGNIQNAWFKISGTLEYVGRMWDTNNERVVIGQKKMMMSLYLNIIQESNGTYGAVIYSYINGCYQKQGEITGVEVMPDQEGLKAFFSYFGRGTSYQDPQPGQWCPVDSFHVIYGTLTLNKKDNGKLGYDKIKIDFRLINFFPEGVQFGNLKGFSVPPLPSTQICGDSCNTLNPAIRD